VPIEQVSVLVGHSSLRVTEKHYAPWVKARQEQLEKSVRLAWTLEGCTRLGSLTDAGSEANGIRLGG